MNDLYFDTGAIKLFLLGDNRLGSYKDNISAGKVKAFTSMVNMVELYYKTMEDLGTQTAETWYWRILNSDFTIIGDITPPIGVQAGKLKVKYKNTLSIVDSISLALASELNCVLLTTDGGLKSVKEKTRTIHFEI
jgi:hypothetical protein